MPKQRGATSRGWGHLPRDGRGEKWCPSLSLSDLGTTPFSLLIPKHVLRPRLVCAGPSSSTEMNYTKIVTSCFTLSPWHTVKGNSSGSKPIAESATSPVLTDLVPWENKFIHGNIFFLTHHFPSRNNATFQCCSLVFALGAGWPEWGMRSWQHSLLTRRKKAPVSIVCSLQCLEVGERFKSVQWRVTSNTHHHEEANTTRDG